MYWMRKRHRDTSQRGSVLVELAMVVFPLMTIVLGIVEIGGAWKDKSTAVQASRQGARVISSSAIANPASGDPYLGDQQALLAVLAGVPVNPSGGAIVEVRKVVIYDASISDADYQACLAIGEGPGIGIEDAPSSATKGRSGDCNVYLAGNPADQNSLDLVEIQDNSNFGGSGGDWDSEFAPPSRSSVLGSATEVGVYVELFRPWITGLIPGEGMKISGFTVMRQEPPGL